MRPPRPCLRPGALVVICAALVPGSGPGCGPPPAPEELPPRFVFRFEFKDPCDQPIPGLQFELLADPVIRRPERPPGKAPHEWRGHLRGQADEFGEARIDLGTDWGSAADLHAAFAGKIDEVRASPDCFFELGNRAIIEVVLDTFTCAESRARAQKSDEPFVQLYSRTFGDNFRRKRRQKMACQDALPPLPPPEEAEPSPGKKPARGGGPRPEARP